METTPDPAASLPSIPKQGRAAQEFPAGDSSAVSAERIRLSSLVHHSCSVESELPLEQLQNVFRDKQVDFLALESRGRVTGLCSRARLDSLLGSRFGFALHSRNPAHTVQVQHPLLFYPFTSVREVLDRSLARGGNEFQEDVVLVDDDRHLLGLIPVESLATLQSRLVAEQVTELKRQHDLLQRQNRDLFQANCALQQARSLIRSLSGGSVVGPGLVELDPEPAPARGFGARKVRVLVAEDEAVVRGVLQEMLRGNLGCHVDLAPNGAEALALAGESDYDLVISDIRMPVMAGTEFYLLLKDRQPRLAQRFTFITGHPGENSLRSEIARWNVPVLSKPFTLTRLIEVCRPLLDSDEPEARSA